MVGWISGTTQADLDAEMRAGVNMTTQPDVIDELRSIDVMTSMDDRNRIVASAIAEITYLRSVAGKVTRGESWEEIQNRARTAPRQRSADAQNPQAIYDTAKTNSDGAIDPHADAVAQHAAMRDDGKLV